jgi:biotin carboxyl carrier protein
MTYISSVHDKNYTIDTGEEGHERRIVIDGTALDIDCQKLAPLAEDAKGQAAQGGRYSLLIGGKSYEVVVRQLPRDDDEEGLNYEVLVAGQRFEVHVEDERERALIGSLKGTHESGEIMMRAPMPGLVLHILPEVGHRVERGQTIVVLEAMKMENDLATPRNGTIKEIRVNKGQTVNQGDVLAVITGE